MTLPWPRLTEAQILLSSLFLAWIVGFTRLRWGWDWRRCLGLFLVAFPFVQLAVSFFLILPFLLVPVTLEALSPSQLLWSAFLSACYYFVMPLLGLLLIFEVFQRPPRAARAAALGRWLGIPRDTVARDAMHAQGLIAIYGALQAVGFLIAAYLLNKYLVTGIDSQLFDNVTPLLFLTLSVVAGVGEELLFRGILFQWLGRRMSWSAAISLQAFLFGLAHLNYGNPAYIVGPMALGFLLGFVAMRLGLIAAMMIHAEANIFFFILTSKDPFLLTLGAVGVLVSAIPLWLTRTRGLLTLLRPFPPWSLPLPEAQAHPGRLSQPSG